MSLDPACGTDGCPLSSALSATLAPARELPVGQIRRVAGPNGEEVDET